MAAGSTCCCPRWPSTQTKFVTNAGGAAPVECARMVARLARERGINLKVAAVTGDDVTDLVRASDPVLAETREPVSKLGTDIICTNAYLGADAIAAAYAAGADVIVTGRVTDSALALGPIMATLGWQRRRQGRDGGGRACRASARMRRTGDRRLFRRARA